MFVFLLSGHLAIAGEFYCFAEDKANDEVLKINLSATIDVLNKKTQIGKINSYRFLIQVNDDEINGVQFPWHSSITDRNVTNVPYNGRLYKGYLKFNLQNYDSKHFVSTGNLDNLNLIISADYKVTKTEKKTNHWNKKWTWDLETRAHHVIFDINIDDHHGDYIHGECYTRVRVNEIRG